MTVLVVIPIYNERENLPVVVPAVLVHGYGVLIVDDHSPMAPERLRTNSADSTRAGSRSCTEPDREASGVRTSTG